MDNSSVQNGRKTLSNQTIVSVGTSSTVLVTQSPQRVALIISAPSTNRFTLSLDTTAVLDQGVTLYAGGPPLRLTIADDGDLVIRGWSAISATASQNVSVVEVFLTSEDRTELER